MGLAQTFAYQSQYWSIIMQYLSWQHLFYNKTSFFLFALYRYIYNMCPHNIFFTIGHPSFCLLCTDIYNICPDNIFFTIGHPSFCLLCTDIYNICPDNIFFTIRHPSFCFLCTDIYNIFLTTSFLQLHILFFFLCTDTWLPRGDWRSPQDGWQGAGDQWSGRVLWHTGAGCCPHSGQRCTRPVCGGSQVQAADAGHYPLSVRGQQLWRQWPGRQQVFCVHPLGRSGEACVTSVIHLPGENCHYPQGMSPL